MEDVRDAQKKLAQVESDLELAKRKLEEANKDLEEKEKALAQVCSISHHLQNITYAISKLN